MGKGALTLAVTLMVADTWLARASPCKNKYVVNFISVALENQVPLEVYNNFDDENEKRDGAEVCFVIFPLSPRLVDRQTDQA